MTENETMPHADHAYDVSGADDRLIQWPTGVVRVGETDYMTDAKGSLVPLHLVKPMDKLQDEAVRKMMAHAVDLNAQIARFCGHCFDDVGSFQALIAQEYGATVGGKKGNISLLSFDGLMRVSVKVADRIEFGPELQAAKVLVDECLSQWAETSRDEIKALVTRAFQVDQVGKINRNEIFMLLRVEINDPRWIRAMDAVRDSIRVIGSKTYILFHKRDRPDGKWKLISIDLANAKGGV